MSISRLFAMNDNERLINIVCSCSKIDEERRIFKFHEISISLKKNNVTMQIKIK